MIYGQGGTEELTKNIEVPLEDRSSSASMMMILYWPHSLSP